MKFELETCSIWEQGPRPKQEDSIYPAHNNATTADRLFILCDGMGGHSSGEVASSTVCESFARSIHSSCPEAEGDFTDDDFKAALIAAYEELDKQDNGAAKKMGTTLTMLKFYKSGIAIAHIGDSRVYHIRPADTAEDTRIIFQTQDHSLVNDLLKIGELTPEEARNYPHKNIITRAMQPKMERRCKADLCRSADVQAGDYFMLCSDGILEQMEDANIKYIFSNRTGDIQNKAELIKKLTANNRDNHSAWLVRVVNVVNDEAAPTDETQNQDTPTVSEKKNSSGGIFGYISKLFK